MMYVERWRGHFVLFLKPCYVSSEVQYTKGTMYVMVVFSKDGGWPHHLMATVSVPGCVLTAEGHAVDGLEVCSNLEF